MDVVSVEVKKAVRDRQSVLMEWKDLTFEVENKKEGKLRQVLKGVSGYAKPGELLAIMGSSGAGKTV
jgi:ABC-type glutathione transport system ATPase component